MLTPSGSVAPDLADGHLRLQSHSFQSPALLLGGRTIQCEFPSYIRVLIVLPVNLMNRAPTRAVPIFVLVG